MIVVNFKSSQKVIPIIIESQGSNGIGGVKSFRRLHEMAAVDELKIAEVAPHN